MNTKTFAVAFLACAFLFAACEATYGVDVSTLISTSAFQCLIGDGYHFAVPRCYQSNGKTDPNCPSTIKNAWSAGMAHVDAYIFPCYSCGNPANQVKSTVDYLNSNGCKYGMIWFDIEGPQYWSSTVSNNVNFVQSMINEAKTLGISIGIYTSKSQWDPIMGSSTIGSPYPLWYAHYDDNPSFSDFVPFGGWSKPAIKQYEGTTSVCGVGIDKDWYPSS